jgi:hypothetical protein
MNSIDNRRLKAKRMPTGSQPRPNGARGQGLWLMNAHACQPAATVFMRVCGLMGRPQTVTSYHKPKGHADPERAMCSLKEEGLWLRE